MAALYRFGEAGYNDTTTRTIAGDVGIDISTLYYHWGDKQDLYEAVIQDIDDEIMVKFREVEEKVKGKNLAARLEIAIDIMCDYLFAHTDVANLFLFGYFSKTSHGVTLNISAAKYIENIAVAMRLAPDKTSIILNQRCSLYNLTRYIFSLHFSAHRRKSSV